MDKFSRTKTIVRKFSASNEREERDRKRFPCVRMILFIFRLFYAWPEEAMNPHDAFRYRLKGIGFRIVFIYLSVTAQVAYIFSVTTHEELLGSLFVLSTQLVLILKLEFLYKNVSKVQKLFYQLDGELYVPRTAEENVPLAHVRKTTTISWITYLVSSDGVLLFWTILALMKREFLVPSWYPFDYESSYWAYLSILVFQFVAILMNASFNISCDLLVAALLALADAHLHRLSIQLMKIGHNIDLPEGKTKEGTIKPAQGQAWIRDRFSPNQHEPQSPDDVYDDLLKCIIFHQDLTGFIREVLELFGRPIIVQMYCSVFILCITEFQLFTDHDSIDATMHNLPYLLCLVLQLFQYCFYGNEVSYTSEKVHQATAFINYPDMDIKTRKLLILFQQRTAAGINCYAKNVFKIELSMETFVAIIKTSYTFLAVLQTMLD